MARPTGSNRAQSRRRTPACHAVVPGGSLAGQIKAYMDRVGFVCRVNDSLLERKIGAAVTVARRAGELLTFAELSLWFLINGMIVPGSTCWNVGHALAEGDIQNDTEAMTTLDNLAANIQWLHERTQAPA